MMTAQELLEQNGIRLQSYEPGEHSTICPDCSHKRKPENQKKECLSVKIDEKGATWYCHHCRWSGPPKDPTENGGDRSKHPTYIYRTADGTSAFRKLRGFDKDGQKFFWIERADGNGGWIKGTKDKSGKRLVDTSIIYRLDEVRQAIATGRVIATAEGEKDVNNLWALGIAATCNAHGASEPGKKAKWTKAHSEQLRGADIVVFNDNDAAGYEHADATCKLSLGVAKRVRRLDLAPHWSDMPKGADISDWLALGHTREELDALIEQAPLVEAEHAAEPPKEQAEKAEASDADIEITRLAKLSAREYEQQRKAAAEKLDVRVSILDKLVRAERAELGLDQDDGKQGHAIEFPEPEPWPEPVDGAALLNALAAAIRNHVVMATASSHAAALWVLHDWLLDCFVVTPRLCVRSVTKGCGKTTLLDVLGRVCRRSLRTLNVTPSAVFRMVETCRPTLFIDEADTFLYDNDGLRGVLDGNRKGDTVIRTVGEDFEPRAFATFCACVISLIGSLPHTLHDRSIVIDLRRRLPKERMTPFRLDRAGHLDVLARMAARWAQDTCERVAAADPTMPDGVINREADNWRPLVAIADVAGGRWPKRARKAAIKAHAAALVGDEVSLLEMLLGDIRDLFKERDKPGAPCAEIPSGDLVKALIDVEGRPWADGLGKNRDKPLTQNRLAKMLKPLRIAPEKVGPKSKRVSGYVRAHFKDAFERYLGLEGVSKVDTRTQCDEMGTSDIFEVDTTAAGCPVAKCEKPNNGGLVSGCPVAMGGTGKKTRVETIQSSDGMPAYHGPVFGSPLNYAGPVVPVPDLGPDSLDEHGRPLAASPGSPGLSARTIRAVADEYTERGYANAQETGGDTRTAELDAWLRQRLAELGVRPEHVEAEFERVKAAVWGDAQ